MQIFNQYSLIFGAAFFLIVLSILLFRDGTQKNDFAILMGVITAIFIFWLFSQPKASLSADIYNIRSQIGGGTPTLLEIQSPY